MRRRILCGISYTGMYFKFTLRRPHVYMYGTEIKAPWNFYFDDGAIIGDKATLDARNGICIDKNVN